MRRGLIIGMLAISGLWGYAAVAGVPPATYRTLPNGATLIVSEQRNLPIVMMAATIDAGSRLDPPGREGLANLTAELLTEGTATRSASEISETVDFIGASLGSQADSDQAGVSMSVLGKDLASGVALLADVLQNPSFPDEEIERRREATIAGIRAEEERPGIVAAKAFQRALFGAGPYGHPVEGTLQSVARLTREEIQSFFARYYRPDRTIITVVGDVSVSEIETRLASALASWKQGAELAPAAATSYVPEQRLVTIDKSVTQANIVLGHRGITRDSPDYYAIKVMNYILGGGGFSSRLLDSIRTQRGLAYSVASFFTANKAPGSFQVVMQTKNASASEAIERARAEIDRIRNEPVTDREIAEAKLYLTGSFPLQLDSNREIASFLSQVEFFGLGRDYGETYASRINAVTKEEVLRVAQQYLRPDEIIMVIVGDLRMVSLPPRMGEIPTP